MELLDKQKRYDGIDGLRAFSAIGIILMHVATNAKYNIGGFLYERVIPSMTNLVFLFMTISAFGMCCGYCEKVLQNKMSIEIFYKKRYVKILPYFALLCLIDVIISPSRSALFELFANLTLCFGLLPNAGNISVIGVGWFLGLIFVFYLIFPFFCFLIANKKRAWFVLGVAYIFNLLCTNYFHVGRANIIYCAVFFIAGGLIYLYKEKLSIIVEKYRWICVLVCALSIVLYYVMHQATWITVLMFSVFLIYSLETRKGILENSITKFLSGISMEMYLCHMLIYRLIEKMGFIHMFDSDVLSYIAIAFGTVLGAVIFAVITKWGLKKCGMLLNKGKYIYK